MTQFSPNLCHMTQFSQNVRHTTQFIQNLYCTNQYSPNFFHMFSYLQISFLPIYVKQHSYPNCVLQHPVFSKYVLHKPNVRSRNQPIQVIVGHAMFNKNICKAFTPFHGSVTDAFLLLKQL